MKTELLTKLSDEALMAQFKDSRRKQYFELLVSRYQKKLYNVAFNLLGNDSEAEETVQEAFIRVWRNGHNFKNEANFSGWIFTIMQNLCRDVWRTRKRKNHYETLFFNPLPINENEDNVKGYQQTTNYLGKDVSEADKEVEKSELRTFLMSCLDRLPDTQKRVIILRDIEGHPYKKIALLTGVSIGTVRSRLHYARRKLKVMLK